MALDDADKRYAAMHIMSPWRGHLPFPDGTLEAADRAQVLFLARVDFDTGTTPGAGGVKYQPTHRSRRR